MVSERFGIVSGHLIAIPGPIVRIAPNEYSFDDLQAVKTIYGHGTKFVKVRHFPSWIFHYFILILHRHLGIMQAEIHPSTPA
jgi:hypothetical protein